MSSLFARFEQLRRQLSSPDGEATLRTMLENARRSLENQQRLLTDAAQYGDLNYSRTLALWHARLEVPSGASEQEITRSFRRLVRLYHPDLYVADPRMMAAATELTQQLVAAHNGLLQHFKDHAFPILPKEPS